MAKKDRYDWTLCNENEESFIDKPKVVYIPRIKPLTRAKKEEIPVVKVNLKAQLPALTSTGVRRFFVNFSVI